MSFRYSICNEVFSTPVEETIARVAELGFDGIEIAPFTIADNVEDIPADRRREIRQRAADSGIEVAGLHWLLLKPEGLHLTTADESVRTKTADYIGALARFCGDVGGQIMVLGSPLQRNLEPGTDLPTAMERAASALSRSAQVCGDCGVELLLEPLNPKETTFLRSVEDAIELRDAIDHPAVGYILDVKAMSGFPDGIEGTIRRYGREAGHFHSNQPDGKGPGMGDLDFGPILAALKESGFERWVSSEPFDYTPDPETVARTALETLRKAAAES